MNLEQNWREVVIRQCRQSIRLNTEALKNQILTFSSKTEVFLSTQRKANLPHSNDPVLVFFLSLKDNANKASHAYIFVKNFKIFHMYLWTILYIRDVFLFFLPMQQSLGHCDTCSPNSTKTTKHFQQPTLKVVQKSHLPFVI